MQLVHLMSVLIVVVRLQHQQIEGRQQHTDHLCTFIPLTLCPMEELRRISLANQHIFQTLKDIENHIFETTKIKQTLENLIQNEMNQSSVSIPKLPLHKKFLDQSNIDKELFIHMIDEAHDAIIFYYNSIEHLIKDTSSFHTKNMRKFRAIRLTMQREIICRYRKILDLFANRWSLVDRIASIGHLEGKDRSSIIHDVQSVVVARRLATLIQQLSSVIDELPFK